MSTAVRRRAGLVTMVGLASAGAAVVGLAKFLLAEVETDELEQRGEDW